MGDEVAITVIATGFDSSRKRELTRAQTSAPVEVASALRMARDREEMTNDRMPTAIPVNAMPLSQPAAMAAEAEIPELQPAAAGQPRNGGQELRRGPQQEVEDLDIPAFLRRHR